MKSRKEHSVDKISLTIRDLSSEGSSATGCSGKLLVLAGGAGSAGGIGGVGGADRFS